MSQCPMDEVLSLGIGIWSLVISASAQAPQLINYQGRLLNGTNLVNGILAQIPLLGSGGLNLGINIYSWAGLVWVYSLHGVPYVYLVVSASLRNLDPSLEEASRISGAGLWRRRARHGAVAWRHRGVSARRPAPVERGRAAAGRSA